MRLLHEVRLCDGFNRQPCGRVAIHTYETADGLDLHACPTHARMWDCFIAALSVMDEATAMDLAGSLGTR